MSALFAVALAAAAEPQAFRIGEVAMSLQPPAGYCIPTGKAATAIDVVSAADDKNVTVLALVMCDDTDATKPDYYLLKTPKSAVSLTFERTAFLADLVKALALPEFNGARGMNDNEAIEKRFNEVMGQQPDINGAIKPLGHDEMCGYMGGVLSMKTEAVSYSRSVSVCLTTIGGKVIGITRYSEGAMPANVLRHLASAKALAAAIKVGR